MTLKYVNVIIMSIVQVASVVCCYTNSIKFYKNIFSMKLICKRFGFISTLLFCVVYNWKFSNDLDEYRRNFCSVNKNEFYVILFSH